MIKLALLIILMAPALLPAQELCTSSLTVNTVSIASHTATLVDSASIRLSDRKWVEAQNASTDVIRCAQSSFTSHSVGRILTVSGGTWEPPITDGYYTVSMSTYSPHVSRTFVPVGIYCINAGTNTVGSVVLSQCK